MKYFIVFSFLVNIVFSEDCTVTQNVEMIKDAMVINSAQKPAAMPYGFSYDAAPTTVAQAAAVCSKNKYFSLYTPAADASEIQLASKGSRCGQLAYGQYVWAGYPGSVYAAEECVCNANQYRLDYQFITQPGACLEAAKYAWDTAKNSSTRFYVTKEAVDPDLSVSWEECMAYSRGELGINVNEPLGTNVSWANARGCLIDTNDGRVFYNVKDTSYKCNEPTANPEIGCVQKANGPRFQLSGSSSYLGTVSGTTEEECRTMTSGLGIYQGTANREGPVGCIKGTTESDAGHIIWNNCAPASRCRHCGWNNFLCVQKITETIGMFANRPFGLKEDFNPNNFDPTDTSNQCGPCDEDNTRVLGTCWDSEPQCSQAFYYRSYSNSADPPADGCYLYSPDATRENHRIIYSSNSFSLTTMSLTDPVVVYNGKYDLLSNMPKITECKTCSSVPEGHVTKRPCGDAQYNNFLRDTGVEACVTGKNYAANSEATSCTPCTKINYHNTPPTTYTTATCTTSSDTAFGTCNGTLEHEKILTYEECKNISILSRQQANANAVETYPGVKTYGTWNGWNIGLYIGGWTGIVPAPIDTFETGNLFSYRTDLLPGGTCRLYNSPGRASHRIIWDGGNDYDYTPEIVFSNGQYRLSDYYRKCNPVCGPGYGGNHCSLCAINEYNAVNSYIGTACSKKKCPVGKGSPKLTNYNASQVDSETEDCVDCPQGEFSPNDNDGQCGVCSTVKAGHETVSICTAGADTVTQACDANSYQPEEKLGYINVSCIPFPAKTPDSGKYVKHSLKITGLTKQQADAKKPQIRKGIASALGKNVEDIKDLSIKVSNSRRRRLLEQPAVLVEYNIVVLDKAAADTLINSLENTNFQTSLEGELGSNVGVESNNPVYSFTACKTKGYDNYVDSSTAVQDKELCACDDGKVYALFEFIGCITWLWFIFIIVGTVLVLICIGMLIYTLAKNNKASADAQNYTRLDNLAYRPRQPRKIINY